MTLRLHPSITADRVIDAVERRMFSLDNPGFCLNCGEDAEGVKPDARKYKCEHCGKRAVCGADELLLMMVP
jgi:hypothetical protein